MPWPQVRLFDGDGSNIVATAFDTEEEVRKVKSTRALPSWLGQPLLCQPPEPALTYSRPLACPTARALG